MPDKFTAKDAKKLTELNQLTAIVKKIESVSRSGKRKLIWAEPIPEKILSQLKDLDFKYTYDELIEKYEITW